MKGSKKVRFTTLFMRTNNNNLLKDVGMIPYTMFKSFGYDSTIACYENEKEWTPLENEVKGLKLNVIKKKHNNMTIDGVRYLLKNSRKIDILNVYHLVLSRSFVWALIYKIMNPRGKVYLKMDIDLKGIEFNSKGGTIKRFLQKIGFKLFYVISAETDASCEYFKNEYGLNRIIKIPNGFYEPNNIRFDEESFHNENVLFTAARLGSEQKATDILMEGFRLSAYKHNWNLVLAGTIEEEFKKYIKEFFKEYPEMKERIIFIGSIENKNELWKIYRESKIFILPSRWEGFSLAIIEAIANGCFPLLSDAVISKNEMTNNGEFGSITKSNDVLALSDTIVQSINYIEEMNNKKVFKDISKYAYENFEWNEICKRLNDKLSI